MIDDKVDHPLHYTNGDIECIDAIKASMTTSEFYGYLKGNVIKYLWRYQLKDNPVQDLKKAKWYLERLIKEESLDTLQIGKTTDCKCTIPSQENRKGIYEEMYERTFKVGMGERGE